MVAQILQDCQLTPFKDGYLLDLPNYTISNYNEFKNQIQQIGGVWKNGKGFYFSEDPTILINWLKKGNLDFKKKNNFYATPDNVAFEMVENIHLYNGIKILEPSAGQGVFIEALIERFMNDDNLEEIEIHFCEIDEYNYIFLERLQIECGINTIIKGKKLKLKGFFGDFLTLDLPPIYDLIIGNPPFTGVENHIKKMINCLAGEIEGDCSNIQIILPSSFYQLKQGTYHYQGKYRNDDYCESKNLLKVIKHQNFTFYTSIQLLDKKTFSKAMANVQTAIFSISGIFSEGFYAEEEEEIPKKMKAKKEKILEKPKEIQAIPQPEIIAQESENTPQKEVTIPKPQLSLF
jgi:phospholipid N-methyltransferase